MSETLTSKERIARILRREPVDRVGLGESFWADTRARWAEAGHVSPDENLPEHFGHDYRLMWAFNSVADLDYGEDIVEETDETKLVRNGNGALLRWWKGKSGTPEHVDFLVKDRAGWDEHVRPHLVNADEYRRRINFEGYRKTKAYCAERDLFFMWSGVNVFELIHPVCGHEYMLIGMALDPDWVKDMCDVFATLTIDLMEILFAAEGVPDGIWFYEDMGFKQRPFMSPAMYRDIIFPAHQRTCDYAHARGLPVVMHSCGYVEPLLEGMIEAGIDCLQAMEVKAGMDLLKLKARYGDRIAFCGGLDIRELESNDLDRVRALIDATVPAAMDPSGYILHTDHSVSSRVDYETYRTFVEYGLKVGTY